MRHSERSPLENHKIETQEAKNYHCVHNMSRWGNNRSNGASRGNRRRAQGRSFGHKPESNGICRFFQRNGHCKFGENCKFSHDIVPEREKKPREEEPPTQLQARDDYNYWKRFLKSPPRLNDNRTALQLWSGALEILNGDQTEWKQMVPRELDNDDNYI